jgi:hypothetical protein
MATVPQTQTTGKAPRAYYAILDEAHGSLAKVQGTIYFMDSETGALTEIEAAHLPFLTTLGEIGLADTQAIMDQLHGGAAAIACARLQEVA